MYECVCEYVCECVCECVHLCVREGRIGMRKTLSLMEMGGRGRGEHPIYKKVEIFEEFKWKLDI